MKYFAMTLTLLVISSSSGADLSLPFNSSHSQAGEASKHEYDLPQHRKLIVRLKQNSGHMTFNRLIVSLKCLQKHVTVPVYTIKTMCGLKSLDYSAESDSVVLHLTKYNAASILGDCSGEEYTESFALSGKCYDHQQKKIKKSNNEKKDDQPVSHSDSLAQ